MIIPTDTLAQIRPPTSAERRALFRQRMDAHVDELERATRYAAGVRVKLRWLRRWNPAATTARLPLP